MTMTNAVTHPKPEYKEYVEYGAIIEERSEGPVISSLRTNDIDLIQKWVEDPGSWVNPPIFTCTRRVYEDTVSDWVAL